jgi:exodeoxyribonuclease VII small subunit
MNAKRSTRNADDKQPSFEGAMKRLEEIVDEMESGKLSLEDMIARFEEGQGLSAFCTKKLNEVEKKIEKLVAKGEEDVLDPLDAADADTDAAEAEENDLF